MRRTKKEISDFLHSLDLKRNYTEQEKDYDLSFALWEHPDSLKLLNFGLLGGYGYAISYKERGVVFVGCSGTEVDAYIRKFRDAEGAEIFGYLKLLLFDSKNHNKLWIYKHPIFNSEKIHEGGTVEDFAGWDVLIKAHTFRLAKTKYRGPVLEVIFHMNEDFPLDEDGGFVEADKKDAISYLLNERKDEAKGLRKKIIEHPRLKDIIFLEYRKDEAFKLEIFKEIKTKLDEVLN